MAITFSTCWYIFKAKFDPSIYHGWIHNMLSNVNNYNLVVYCDKFSIGFIEPYLKNPRIKAVIKPIQEFSTYELRDLWIDNHSKNELLNRRVGWELNMLWCEKLAFVQQTIRERYFEGFAKPPAVVQNLDSTQIAPLGLSTENDTELFGWCDIGYFRGRPNDSHASSLENWPSDQTINALDKSKIYYACVNNNHQYIGSLYNMIMDRNSMGLSRFPIPDNQISIAGGFFLGSVENLEWWHNTFYSLLNQYFDNGRLVKDDQIIVADGVFSNKERFELLMENNPQYDNWFLFQRFLS